MSELTATHPSSGLVSAGDQDQAVTLVLAFLAGYTGHSRDAYRRDLADWWRWCAAYDLAVLEAARVHVELYARELEAAGRAPSTVARRLAALGGLYQYAVDEGVLVRSPVAHARRPKVATDSQPPAWTATSSAPCSRWPASARPPAGAPAPGT